MLRSLPRYVRSKSRRPLRAGASLLEVLAGTTLAAILLPTTFGVLAASQRIWSQFESGRDATSNRQIAIQDLDQRLALATKIVKYGDAILIYVDVDGKQHSIDARPSAVSRSGFDLYDTVDGNAQVIAEGVGAFSVRQQQVNAAGELVELRIENELDPNRKTLARSTTHSSRLVWVRP
jgi:hypothetical protein